MIVETKKDDIFNTGAKHIAFAINTEGLNDAGFAGEVVTHGWGELTNLGERPKIRKRCQQKNWG